MNDDRNNLIRFNYGLRTEFGAYIDLRIKGTISNLPLGGIRSGERYFSHNQRDEFRKRVLDYLNTTYETAPRRERIARVMGLGCLGYNDDVDLWIQGRDTLERIETDLERIAYNILSRDQPDLRIEDIELKMERRELDWSHMEVKNDN